ncbi:hypothetical protein Ac2012v2_002234 [Leucoagaricus gongylophorus]
MNFDFANVPSNHFLAQPRPDPFQSLPTGFVDTTTLAAHDFDVDNRTGFMPPQPPLQRLPSAWHIWEISLERAISRRLQLAECVEGMNGSHMLLEMNKSSSWRYDVAQMPVLPTEELRCSERALRRAHHVLAWLVHFYVHTIPSHERIIIPRPLSIPLLQVSSQLQLPPVVTYSDDVLYNWAHRQARDGDCYYDDLPTIDNLQCQTTFTGTSDEEEFYLTSARIELKGNEALELMRMSMDEAFVGDDISIGRITRYLQRMAVVIQELRNLLMNIRQGVDTQVFYDKIRPWFKGIDGDPFGRQWVFEGRDEVEGWEEIPEASGASAGQSSLIQALDIFLGVDVEAPETSYMSHSLNKSFQERMRAYMPRHHRAFLNHLRTNPRPLRALVDRAVEEKGNISISEAYNAALRSMKEFRDAHMIIVALYIIGPARRAGRISSAGRREAQEKYMTEAFHTNDEVQELKGTGGTDLIQFLKGVRDQTANTYLQK